MLKTNIKNLKNIESSIRNIQRSIIRMKKDKKMIVDIGIISDLIENEWKQDRIEKIRDEKRGDKR